MAAIAVGMIYIPSSLFAPAPGRRTVTLDEANRQIGFSIMNHLDQHNKRANGMTQEERNQLLMEAYGERSSLEDMERAIAGLDEVNRRAGPNERNDVLEEAYGSRSSLKDIRRAMEIYEVQ
ncbi:hypothetical protein BS50DRAFT_566809 [Corynespora cassiicola Philippines]|uniref:Uncharacterized protein n=1 Tax=Corynespora cassiicola Philippines TaxID=1448308 RepID=A0A2T2P8I9_CORCC|nr:hypothetical protein BS50DRAFT_566809 [Corynespora cassiicola Philippines]